MDKSKVRIHIIGAGISGLVAAIHLEKNGYQPTIIEADQRVGGRIQSDVVNDYILDRGFQVMLTAYPMAKKYLNFEALELQKLEPGAVIFRNGKSQTIGDPLRELSFFLPTTFSSVGSLSDKLKIFKLNQDLQKKSIEAIFEGESKSTLDYLKERGFSNTIIENFFKPFFSGIFLETELSTPSSMFEFVYKMFGDGYAAIPKAGMQAISDQLASQLKNTTFLFNTRVQEIKDHQIILEKGTTIETDYTLIATEPSALIASLSQETISWNSSDTLYFECPGKLYEKAIIGLIADDNDVLINNIFYHTSISTKSKLKHQLLSVTIVKRHSLNSEELVARVQEELKTYCGIDYTVFLKHYHIPKGLPKLSSLHAEIAATETKLTDRIYLAGDYLLNSSSNAAMLSGERAAEGVIAAIEGSILS